MKGLHYLKSALAGGASVVALIHPATAKVFDIPGGDLSAVLAAYVKQSNVEVAFADDDVRGHKSRGAKGNYTETAALNQLLQGTGFTTLTTPSNAIVIVQERAKPTEQVAQMTRPHPAASAPVAPQGVETVVVTAQHKSENIQQVPIAISAFTQQQLTERQIAGGPDLVKEVPNLTFSKTNFTGYNLEIRGIGTQAISVTTDPAVAVAFNDTPFIRNHFFEQEFYDLADAEVLRGPQGTLYGRNATAGVVNIKSALPMDSYEAMLSADLGNYNNRRLEGMLNIPIVGDTLDIRFAGEWTKRDGYTEDTTLNTPVDGRDLWSGRMTIGWKPTSDLQTYLVWEHFSEDDDRLRSGKQLCKTDQPPTSVNGVSVMRGSLDQTGALTLSADYLSQGCADTSLYSPDAFEVPYGFSLPYALAAGVSGVINTSIDPYAETTQSTNLRDIQSVLQPTYKAKNDTLEFNATYNIDPALTLTSQTGYNQDFLWSTEDYNRFDTSPGIFAPGANFGEISSTGNFCDPQLGCSSRLVAEDLSDEHAWQLSQEFRLASNFSGPLNFSVGGNYLHYETEENYYVFINALTVYAISDTPAGDYLDYGGACRGADGNRIRGVYQYPNPFLGGGSDASSNCIYIDTNPIGSLDNEGHNYFRSDNPYTLNSYALFGETYYNIANDLKLTAGLRWTDDRKHFIDIPSELDTYGYGYPVTGIVNQQWEEFTGRTVVDWTPKLDFTDQTLVYGSYSRGYKAGGANPPGAILLGTTAAETPIHPLTFKPEFIDAFELGSKNTLLDGALTLNGDIFYYDYKNYQISEIVDRTSINLNLNAAVKGAELETTWEPAPGLKFNFAGGYEDATLDNGDSAIDLMDRTAGMPGWMVVKPFPTQASNCILPTYVVQAVLEEVATGTAGTAGAGGGYGGNTSCSDAYLNNWDPATGYPYRANPTGQANFNYAPTAPIPAGYPGFNPLTAPNNGEGFAKNLGGNQLPNAPHFTTSLTAEYTIPVSADWAATFHTDFYWQSQQWARVFEDPIDKIHGYSNVNVSLILTSANGWQVMGYVKNVFDVTAITGTFLNSDDSGLTTNIFLTDPRLYGVRVTKQLDQNDGFWGSDYSGYDFFTDLFADKDGGKPPLWIELGGQMEHVGGQGAVFSPGFLAANPSSLVLWKETTPLEAQQPSPFSFGEEAKVSYQPKDSDWIFSAAVRVGRSSNFTHIHHQTDNLFYKYQYTNKADSGLDTKADFADTQSHHSESHSILDFMAGKDVGLGLFGLDGSSVLSGGIRIAQFSSRSSVDMRALPDRQIKYYSPPAFPSAKFVIPHFNTYHATGQASRKFHGVGPSIAWTGSADLVGDPKESELTFDWGANAAILFGRQRTRVEHHESAQYYGHLRGDFNPGSSYVSVYNHPPRGHVTDRAVIVPNLGGFAGISWRYNNAKVSFGYRTDFFFGAIDGGIDVRKSETLNMGGPFATVSFGLGG